MRHQHGLGFFTLHRHEAHRGARYRFANRLRVGLVRLVPLHVSLHIAGLHQLDVVAEPPQFARPVMRAGTGFHTDQARWLTPEELMHLAASQLAAQLRAALGINTVQLKNRLGQIDPGHDNIAHAWLPSLACSQHPNVAHCDAGSGSHPPHQWRSHGSIWLDAAYLKMRQGGRIVPVAALIAVVLFEQNDEWQTLSRDMVVEALAQIEKEEIAPILSITTKAT